MGPRSGGSEYEYLILDKGNDPDKLDKFLEEHKVCGWDGKHFHGEYSWHIAFPEDDYDSDKDYSLGQLTKDFPGCVLFGWCCHHDDFSCYPECWNQIIVNGHSYMVSKEHVDGYGVGTVFTDDLIIDFAATYKLEDEEEERAKLEDI